MAVGWNIRATSEEPAEPHRQQHVSHTAHTQLFVADLDAIDGTPVLDLKPVMQELRCALRNHERDR
jgi:tRNA (Thr-GGU) A37 N-methylase